MKSSIVIFSIAAIALSSCSSVYRTAQTPDDIYYSPGREAAESYVQVDNQNDRAGRYRTEEAGSGDYYTPDDRVLRMKVRNPQMWSAFDDYGYGGLGYSGLGYGGYGGCGMGYGGYGYSGLGYGMGYGGFGYGGLGYSGLGLGIGYGGLGFGYNNFYNNYYGWNSIYNPYYGIGYIGNKTAGPNTRARSFNPNTYSNRTYNSTNASRANTTRPGTYRPAGQNGYNNTNTNTLGTSIRRVFSGSGSGSNNSNANRGSYYTPNSDRPVRSYQPATNNNSSPVRTQSTGSSGSTGGSTGGGSTGGGSTGGRPGRN